MNNYVSKKGNPNASGWQINFEEESGWSAERVQEKANRKIIIQSLDFGRCPDMPLGWDKGKPIEPCLET
ncbi:MAG: hypothetical protein AAF399_09005 [Bacteroidota bacterium]